MIYIPRGNLVTPYVSAGFHFKRTVFFFNQSNVCFIFSAWNFPCQPWGAETEHVTQWNAGMLHNALTVCQECCSWARLGNLISWRTKLLLVQLQTLTVHPAAKPSCYIHESVFEAQIGSLNPLASTWPDCDSCTGRSQPISGTYWSFGWAKT